MVTRRNFLRLMGAASALGALNPAAVLAQAKSARVVIVGGGFGGATCAKYLRRRAPDMAITLVEREPRLVTCPFSNTVIGGLNGMDAITHDYDTLKSKYRIDVVQDTAASVDPARRRVMLQGGKALDYDRLVIAPGIDLRFDAIPGYDQAAVERMPHAWKAGEQTLLLRKQLEGMKDGGTVIITAPDNPYRCPPGPYERASLIAHYLKESKPKSKIIILDAKDKFPKQELFFEGWDKLYPGMIEWIPAGKGGTLVRVDPKTMAIETQLDKYRPAVANVIPPQRAGAIAVQAGLANAQGWCPVDARTFESTMQKGIHVIGDSCLAGGMPKSAYSANSQAKVCADAVAALLAGRTVGEAPLINTCYSLIGPNYGISVAAVYRITDKEITPVEGAGGVSPKGASASFRGKEAKYTRAWYKSIMADTLGQ